MKKKAIFTLSLIGAFVLPVVTMIPICLYLINNKFSNTPISDGTSQDKPINPDNPNVPDVPSNSDGSIKYENKVNPITDGSYAFSTYDKVNDSINYSIGPTNVPPSSGVESAINLTRGYLYSDLQALQAKRTLGINFLHSTGINSGTAWILDYKLTSDNSYPLTWYFGTNAHVLDNLKVPNDTISPERYEKNDSTYNTQFVEFVTLNDFTLDQEMGNSSGKYYTRTKINPIDGNNNTRAKTVFIGNDYLKTSPSMYSKTERWQKYEEYADFAVMEFTFDNVEQARLITHNYADNIDNQFKYKKESLLAKQENIKSDNYSIVGFPAVINNPYLSTIAINRPAPVPLEQKRIGSNLGTSPYYNSYYDKKGAFDAALSLSYFGYSYEISKSEFIEEYYLSWGLMYPCDYSHLSAGSSGSLFIDLDGYALGVYFASDERASMGLVQALYSEGFDYQGSFGKYNLEGYDLIDGGFPNQKKSYRDGLIQLYGNSNDFKTNLYPNGINR